MTQIEQSHQQGTLLGAMDCYLKVLMRARPHLVALYGDALGSIAARWLAGCHGNDLANLNGAWLRAYLATAEYPALTEEALRDFLHWAEREQLIMKSPLG